MIQHVHKNVSWFYSILPIFKMVMKILVTCLTVVLLVGLNNTPVLACWRDCQKSCSIDSLLACMQCVRRCGEAMSDESSKITPGMVDRVSVIMADSQMNQQSGQHDTHRVWLVQHGISLMLVCLLSFGKVVAMVILY